MTGMLLLSAVAIPAPAQHAGTGTAIFDFLNIKYDARTVAMGGASVALPNDLYGAFTNPAAVGFIENMQVMAGNRSESVGLWGFPLAYARPEKEMGVFAVNVIALTTGNIEVTDRGNDGAMIATGRNARSDDIAGSITWAKKLNNFSSAGISVKGIYNRLGTSGSGSESFSADGFAMDAGLQYRFKNSRLVYGLATRNVGFLRAGYTSGESYDLPAAIEMGVSYIPEYISNLRLALDIGKKNNDYLTFAPAAELEVIRGQMVLRAGLNRSWRDLKSYLMVLKGEPEENYQQSNRSAFCAGVGLITQIVERRAKFDVALDFADNPGLLPAFVISLMTDLQ
jgi:hypothetical protein